jgi:hypothetical protein
MLDEGHRALKRWERSRQLEGLRHEPEEAGPLAWCRVRASEGPGRVPVRLLALFAGDFAYVRTVGEAAPPGVPGPAWLTRAAIEWDGFLRRILLHYAQGRPVPAAFIPIRKLPSELMDRLRGLPDRLLPEIFLKLRGEGLLPALPALSRASCPPGLPWEDLRARFQDFKEARDAAGLTDSPPR